MMLLEEKIMKIANDTHPWNIRLSRQMLFSKISNDKDDLDPYGWFDLRDIIKTKALDSIQKALEKLVAEGKLKKSLVRGHFLPCREATDAEKNKCYRIFDSAFKYISGINTTTFILVVICEIPDMDELKKYFNEKHPWCKVEKIEKTLGYDDHLNYTFTFPESNWEEFEFVNNIFGVEYFTLKGISPNIQEKIPNKEELLLKLIKRDKDQFMYIQSPEKLGNAKEVFKAAGKAFDDRVDEKADSEPYTCKICIENKIKLVFGCGHSTCFSCSDKLEKCPTCREVINHRIKLFL